MITLTREEAQQVLDALEGVKDMAWDSDTVAGRKLIETIRARLSAPDDVPQWIYQKSVPADTEVHHWAVVMHDLDKTVEGWSEDVKLYYDGKLIAPQPEPKPVAWRKLWEGETEYTYYWMNRYQGSEPLYTAPPQREWQGLTDEEKKAVYQEAANEDWTDIEVINTVEAKLKEKNG